MMDVAVAVLLLLAASWPLPAATDLQDQVPGGEGLRSSFSCRGRVGGYYADIETGCKLYHLCDGVGRQFTHACPNLTLFHQRMMVCDHWYMVNCSATAIDYATTLLLGHHEGRLPLEEGTAGDLEVRNRGGDTSRGRVISFSFSSLVPTGDSSEEASPVFRQSVNSRTNPLSPEVSTKRPMTPPQRSRHPAISLPVAHSQRDAATLTRSHTLGAVVEEEEEEEEDRVPALSHNSNRLKSPVPKPELTTRLPPVFSISVEEEEDKEGGDVDNGIEIILQDPRRMFFIPDTEVDLKSVLSTTNSTVLVIPLPSPEHGHRHGAMRFRSSSKLLEGRNPRCPRCHPVFLVPGQCQPCVLIR